MKTADEKSLSAFLGKSPLQEVVKEVATVTPTPTPEPIVNLSPPTNFIADLNNLLTRIDGLLNNPMIQKFVLKDVMRKEEMTSGTPTQTPKTIVDKTANVLNVNVEEKKREKAELFYNGILAFFDGVIQKKPEVKVSELLDEFKTEKAGVIDEIFKRI